MTFALVAKRGCSVRDESGKATADSSASLRNDKQKSGQRQKQLQLQLQRQLQLLLLLQRSSKQPQISS
jgi:hypothetical protein